MPEYLILFFIQFRRLHLKSDDDLMYIHTVVMGQTSGTAWKNSDLSHMNSMPSWLYLSSKSRGVQMLWAGYLFLLVSSWRAIGSELWFRFILKGPATWFYLKLVNKTLRTITLMTEMLPNLTCPFSFLCCKYPQNFLISNTDMPLVHEYISYIVRYVSI